MIPFGLTCAGGINEPVFSHKDGKYEIRIPWKKDEQLDNYSMALNHLATTEKQLLKNTASEEVK